MEDYRLSQVKSICKTHICDNCPIKGHHALCPVATSPDGWMLDDDVEIDNVNHPQHYTSGCGFECIEILKMVLSDDEFYGFCIGNAIKYIWRHQQKGGMEDILKAKWYLETIQDVMPKHYPDDTFLIIWNKVDKLLNA